MARIKPHHFFQIFIALGIVFIAWEIVSWVHPPALAWGLAVAGRKPMCSTGEVYSGAVVRVNESSAFESTKASAVEVERDKEAGLTLLRTADGEIWTPTGSEEPTLRIISQQTTDIYSFPEGAKASLDGAVVLDCGAHIGLYSRRVLKQGAKLVVAIEPAPINLECLRRNLREEIAEGRVKIVPKGVWDSNAVLEFFEQPSNSAADSFVARVSTDKVTDGIEVTTIDNLATELGLESVGVIKMDIKGATIRALNGSARVIESNHPRFVISTEEKEDDPIEISSLLAGKGYKVRCGRCSISDVFSINPDVLFFSF